MAIRIGSPNSRTPDKKRTNVAGELGVTCIGVEIVYTIKVEYPPQLGGYDVSISARRPGSAGCQIDRADGGIEKNLDTLSQPGAVDRCVVLRLAFELSRQDDPGHLRRRPGDIGAVNVA